MHFEQECGFSPFWALWTLVWECKEEPCAYDIRHVWHEKGFYPECTLSWLLNLLFSPNVFWHLAQENLFTLKCTKFSCVVLWAIWVNVLSHWLQEKGFSSVWSLSWTTSWVLVMNFFSQCLHWNFLTLTLWVFWWLRRVFWDWNDPPHFGHGYCFPTLWVSWWLLRCCFRLNVFSQIAHANGVSLECIIWWLFKFVADEKGLSHWGQSLQHGHCDCVG